VQPRQLRARRRAVAIGQVNVRLLQTVVKQAKIRRARSRALPKGSFDLRAFVGRKSYQANREPVFRGMHDNFPHRLNLVTIVRSDKHNRPAPTFYFPSDKIECAGTV
jgi:hypothetical protein